MKKIIILGLVTVLFIFSCSLDGGTIYEDPTIETSETETPIVETSEVETPTTETPISDFLIGSRVVDSTGSPINLSVGSASIDGIHYISQDAIEVTRSLSDEGNVIDFVEITTGVTLFNMVDGSVMLDAGSTIIEILPDATEVYFYQTQFVANTLFIGADNSLYTLTAPYTSTPTKVSGDIDVFAVNDPSGTNDESIMYMVSPNGLHVIAKASGKSTTNFALAIHDEVNNIPTNHYEYEIEINLVDGDVDLYWRTTSNVPDASNTTLEGDEPNIARNFSNYDLVIAGDYYIDINMGTNCYVDNATGAAISSTIPEVTFGLIGLIQRYNGDIDAHFTDGRHDLGLGSHTVVVIPKTSTYMEDWYNNVYNMYDTDRWYITLNVHGDVVISHVTISDNKLVVEELANSFTIEDFIGDDTLVDDFWIGETGIVYFSNPPVDAQVGYTNL